MAIDWAAVYEAELLAINAQILTLTAHAEESVASGGDTIVRRKLLDLYEARKIAKGELSRYNSPVLVSVRHNRKRSH